MTAKVVELPGFSVEFTAVALGLLGDDVDDTVYNLLVWSCE